MPPAQGGDLRRWEWAKFLLRSSCFVINSGMLITLSRCLTSSVASDADPSSLGQLSEHRHARALRPEPPGASVDVAILLPIRHGRAQEYQLTGAEPRYDGTDLMEVH